MQYEDKRNIMHSASSVESLDRFENVLNCYLGTVGDPESMIDDILSQDPDFISGHCFKLATTLFAFERKSFNSVLPMTCKLKALAKQADDRESAHIAAITAWAKGDLHSAATHWDTALKLEPMDLFALRMRHDLAYYLGDCRNLRDCVGRVRADWDTDAPGFGYLLGMHSFGLEECGDYERAEETGLEALERYRKDSWAVHSLAHVYEMTGRRKQGIDWLVSREKDWTLDSYSAVHNWWHLALNHLDLCQYDRVLALYDDPIRGEKSRGILNLIDAASLLWRFYLLGIDVGEHRWQELVDAWAPFAHDGLYAFNDIHIAMAFAASGRIAEAREFIGRLQKIADGPVCANQMAVASIGLPASLGFLAFAEERYGEAVEHLLPMRHRSFNFGGSHAQRDVFSWTVIEAMLRDGQYNNARVLLNERIELKSTSPQNWLMMERALEGAGDTARAAQANHRAMALM